MKLTRRQTLSALSVGALTPWLPGCPIPMPPVDAPTPDATPDAIAPDAADALAPDALAADADADVYMEPPRPYSAFLHGVASGDPLPDAVILWTRVTPRDPAAQTTPVEVRWEIATDPTFATTLRTGMLTTDASRDFTVKLDATGLSPATTYYYRFRALDFVSPVGRTRTAPTGGVSRLRFAVVSCSSFAHGYFHSYRALARRLDLDAVIHLGDYIYEYATGRYGSVRPYEPAHEIVSLADYRTRYAQYRRDRDLRAVHQQHPMIAVWDDHESANDSWRDGAENHDAMSEGEWQARRRAAAQAYREWMPIREQPDDRIYRRLRFGDLVDLIMLDTRLWGRSMQVGGTSPALTDPTRTLLGMDQEIWLQQQLMDAGARWKLLGQQVMVGQLPQLLNTDQWDGYPAARTRFFDLLRTMSLHDVVVLTGDIHTSWAMDITEAPNDPTRYDRATGMGSLAVEFVTPAVSSPGLSRALASLANDLVMMNPHMKFVELTQRGYVILDVTAERTQAAWYLFDDVVNREGATERFAAAFSTQRGQDRLRRDMTPAPAPLDPPAGAPPEDA